MNSLKANPIKLGAILSYLSIAINMIAGLIYTPWMVDQLGKSQYGIYTLATSLITLLMVDFGLSSAVGKYVTNYHAANDEEGVNRILGIVYKLYLLVDAIIFIVLIALFFLADTIYAKLTPQEIEQFKIAYIIVSLYSLVSFPFVTFNGILTAYEKFIHIKVAEIIHRCTTVIMTVIALSLGWGLYALVTVNAISGLLTIAYKYIAIKRTTPVKVNFRFFDTSLLKEMLGFSIWITVHSLAQRLIFNITPSILGIVADSESIAVFGVITTIEGYVYLIVTALNGLFMPKISRVLQGNDDEKSIMPLMLNVGRFQFAINCAIIVGFISIGKDFISLWMGEGYIDAYIGIMLVIIPGLFYNPLQIAHTAMIVEGKAKQLAFINIIAGLANVTISVVLSSVWGVIGASISIMIAYFARNILVMVIYPKCIRIDLWTFSKECFLKPLILAVICLLAGLTINNAILGDTWGRFIIKGMMIVAVMIICTCIYYYHLKKDAKKNKKGAN
jgi:O-antigen/teichoic acid export membrane protein